VEISSDGKLRIGPTATEILTTPSTFVWSVAADAAGNAYLATGSPSKVLRVGKDGKAVTLFETKSLAVQVLRLGPDGALYAATLPDGKVYRLHPDAKSPVDESSAEVVFDLAVADIPKAGPASPESAKSDSAKTDGSKGDAAKNDSKSRYIWDLTFDSPGRLYIATGGPAAIFRLDVKQAGAKPELYFHCDEQHIRVLAWEKSGSLLAGTDGSGLVYRITPQPGLATGKGYVLFSAPRREITALATGADGTIFAADVGDKSRNPLPALPIQNGAGITITFVQPGSVQAANASTTLPEGSEIYALAPNAAPRKLWSDKDSIVYWLGQEPVASTTSGHDGITALTGNRGRILRIRRDGSYSDIAHLDAQQAVAATEIPTGWLIGTANTGKLYRLETGASSAGDHSYSSDVLDAGALSRWGRVEVEPASIGYQILTRSGNVEQPARNEKDWGWSDWQAANGDKIASPPGRYLQWKIALAANGVAGSVGVNYLPVNSAPVVDDIVVVPGARVTPQPPQAGLPTVNIAFPAPAQNAGNPFDANAANNAAPIQAQKDRTAVTVRWAAHDDDGDDLTFHLFLRGDGEKTWRAFKKNVTERVYSFDAASLPDGGYEIRVVASDAPSHTPGDVLTGELTSERFEIDTTPPVVDHLKAGAAAKAECKASPCKLTWNIPVQFDAKDATSPISHAEYSLDAGPWQYVDPVGELSDSKEEHYSFVVPVPAGVDPAAEHLISVRVYDRHDNAAAAKTIVPETGAEARSE
jgi:hypothetical protein